MCCQCAMGLSRTVLNVRRSHRLCSDLPAVRGGLSTRKMSRTSYAETRTSSGTARQTRSARHHAKSATPPTGGGTRCRDLTYFRVVFSYFGIHDKVTTRSRHRLSSLRQRLMTAPRQDFFVPLTNFKSAWLRVVPLISDPNCIQAAATVWTRTRVETLVANLEG